MMRISYLLEWFCKGGSFHISSCMHTLMQIYQNIFMFPTRTQARAVMIKNIILNRTLLMHNPNKTKCFATLIVYYTSNIQKQKLGGGEGRAWSPLKCSPHCSLCPAAYAVCLQAMQLTEAWLTWPCVSPGSPPESNFIASPKSDKQQVRSFVTSTFLLLKSLWAMQGLKELSNTSVCRYARPLAILPAIEHSSGHVTTWLLR